MNILFFLHFRKDFLAQPYPTLIFINWAILLYFVDVLVLYNLNILIKIKILCYGLRIERFTIARSILTTKTGRLQGRNSLQSFNLLICHFCKLLPSSFSCQSCKKGIFVITKSLATVAILFKSFMVDPFWSNLPFWPKWPSWPQLSWALILIFARILAAAPPETTPISWVIYIPWSVLMIMLSIQDLAQKN